MTAPPEEDHVLRAHALHHAYEGSPALQGAALVARPGEIVSVTGPRGSGKSTLLGCLSGQLAVQQGEIWFGEVPVHRLGRTSRDRLRRERFGWVGSAPQLVPELTVRENTALPLLLNGARHRDARKRADEWLRRLDIGSCARRRPAELLQSQRQRVCLARALVHSPAVLFADEPTAPLHQADRTHLLRALTAAARSHGITVVLTTHESAVVLPDPGPGRPAVVGPTLSDRTLSLLDGRTPDGGAPPEPRRHDPAGTAREPGEHDDHQGRDACSLSV